jgi:phosphomannomutase
MHLFFDLDNTVTRSRSPITQEMKAFLSATPHDVTIVSGATCPQIAKQMGGTLCYKLGQNGNHALDPTGATLWEATLSEDEMAEIHTHIASLPRDWNVPDESDLVQDRGCQVSYSLLGHNAVLEEKEAFDPTSKRRKTLLAEHPFVSDTLDVRIGGTTCLDYTAKGKHKGHYVARLIEHMGWRKEDSIYFGDMLFPGGNDESVMGVIPTQQVDNPVHTLTILKERYSA